MKWFEGSIASAIATARNKQAIFLVFVHGEDETSKQMESIYSDSKVAEELKNSDTVGIKIKSDSTECQQFSQIYPVVLVPSSYFIAINGVPLEIIGGNIESNEMLEKLHRIFNAHKDVVEGSQPINTSSEAPQNEPKVAEETQTNALHSNPVTNRDLSDVSGAHGAAESNSLKETAEIKENDEDSKSKKERAEELIKIQRSKKLAEEQEKERQKEIERIKVGQEMQKFKDKQKEDEAKQLVQDLAKEKADDKKAKERIRAQIAQDKEERAAKYRKEKQEIEKQKTEQQEKVRKEKERLAAQRSTIARLQFRLPDGSTLTESFPAEDSLQTARNFICDKKDLSAQSFTMSVSFPRRQFTENDMSQSFRDLQLAPSAVIIIVPTQSVFSSTDSGVNTIMWSIVKPFMYLYGLLYNFLFGQPQQQVSPTASDPRNRKRNQETPEPQPGSSQASKRRAVNEKSPSVQVGNIHRFRNNEDDDDEENNTWNGNSTQQM